MTGEISWQTAEEAWTSAEGILLGLWQRDHKLVMTALQQEGAENGSLLL